MLLDPATFAFTKAVEAGYPTFRREFHALRRDDFELWPDTGAYHGEWFAFPLFLQSHPAEIDKRFARNQGLCPESNAILRSIPGVVSAGFSWMESGCHIYSHVDAKPENLLRAHLGLEVPSGALMRVGKDQHTWTEGRCLVFDGIVDHETANTAPTRRVVLLVDALLDHHEFGCLKAWRAEHGITAV